MAPRRRKPAVAAKLVGEKDSSPIPTKPEPETMPGKAAIFLRQPIWIILAVSSGTCAAFNGVFAKL